MYLPSGYGNHVLVTIANKNLEANLLGVRKNRRERRANAHIDRTPEATRGLEANGDKS
jgi:hypothetical protein